MVFQDETAKLKQFRMSKVARATQRSASDALKGGNAARERARSDVSRHNNIRKVELEVADRLIGAGEHPSRESLARVQ
ncbi:MAG: hypothetical protein WCI59_21255 [Betaproteobacteria bacterium]